MQDKELKPGWTKKYNGRQIVYCGKNKGDRGVFKLRRTVGGPYMSMRQWSSLSDVMRFIDNILNKEEVFRNGLSQKSIYK